VWPDTVGEAECPHCGHHKCYCIRTRRSFKCAGCRTTFTVTSGTISHSHKLELRDYLAVILLFVNAVKGISAFQVSRDVGISYKSAFVLLHKLRQAIDGGRANLRLRGDVEIDGAYFGGHMRSGNTGREGKMPGPRSRKLCVLAMVSRTGGTVTKVVPSETSMAVIDTTREHIVNDNDTRLFADEHRAYDALHARYRIMRINHRWSYAEGETTTNAAESFFSRMRRAEIGQYHRISNRYLHRYAAEMAFKSDRRRVDNGAVAHEVAEMSLAHPVSRQWKGYWQSRAA